MKRQSLDAEIVTNRTAEWERGAQNEEDKKNWYLKSDGTNPNKTSYFRD